MTMLSRRHFLEAAAAVLAATAAGAQTQRVLLKGGCVLSLDPKVGDFDVADVLIDGSRIAAVGPNLTASAQVIDASKAAMQHKRWALHSATEPAADSGADPLVPAASPSQPVFLRSSS